MTNVLNTLVILLMGALGLGSAVVGALYDRGAQAGDHSGLIIGVVSLAFFWLIGAVYFFVARLPPSGYYTDIRKEAEAMNAKNQATIDATKSTSADAAVARQSAKQAREEIERKVEGARRKK